MRLMRGAVVPSALLHESKKMRPKVQGDRKALVASEDAKPFFQNMMQTSTSLYMMAQCVHS